jgi:hypothetical protein
MKKQTPASKTARRQRQIFPRGWNEKRVRKVIEYYERQSEDEELAEYEAGMATATAVWQLGKPPSGDI